MTHKQDLLLHAMAVKKEDMAFFKEMARKDLLSFCVYSDKFFEINKHHEIIANALQRFMEGKVKKLILQTPPRSWKSRLICEAIAWAFWNVQNTDIIYTWHSISLLESFSRNIRDRVMSPEYRSIFKDSVKWDNGAVGSWAMSNQNKLMIYGVWWGITGKGWNRLIIDDPYATRQDAESDTIRKRVEDWYDSTFLSRRHNSEAGICLIMQRWREDDLVGYILEKEKDWEIVKIPAVSDEWESFWASRFPVPYLEEMRTNIGDYFFSSQYQQEPFVESWWDFKRDYFRYEEICNIQGLIPRMKIVSFLDPAISTKQEWDFSALVTVWHDLQSNLRYVLEVKQIKAVPNEIIDEVFDTAKYWKNKGQSYKMGIEVVQYQKMLALAIRDEMRKRDFHFTMEEVNPRGEKEARVRSILQPLYSSQSIVHIRGDKINELELELLKFPNGKHDDIIDSLSSACSIMQSSNLSSTYRTSVRNANSLI